MNKVIFVAVAGKHSIENGKLKEQFVKQMAKLHTAHPDITFVSPMLQDVQLLPYLPIDTNADWKTWQARCEGLVAVCKELWVLGYPGWQDSVGVQGEIYFATLMDVPVKVLELECE